MNIFRIRICMKTYADPKHCLGQIDYLLQMSGSSSAGRTFPLRGTNVKKITLPRQQAWPEPGGGRAVGHGHGQRSWKRGTRPLVPLTHVPEIKTLSHISLETSPSSERTRGRCSGSTVLQKLISWFQPPPSPQLSRRQSDLVVLGLILNGRPMPIILLFRPGPIFGLHLCYFAPVSFFYTLSCPEQATCFLLCGL